MDKLLEYTRITFEEEHRNPLNLRCANSVEQATSCVCIPGVALNYCLLVVCSCYKEVEAESIVKWNRQYEAYLPECFFRKRKILPNLMQENDCGDTILYEGICLNKTERDFIYIKNRLLDKNYKVCGPQKEILLWSPEESFLNSSDYFKVFLGLAEMYQNIYSNKQYVKNLFKLFLFMFPMLGLRIINENHKNLKGIHKKNKDKNFKKYNKQLIHDYIDMINDCKADVDMHSRTLNRINNFIGFDITTLNQEVSKKSPDNGMSMQGLVNELVNKGFKVLTDLNWINSRTTKSE